MTEAEWLACTDPLPMLEFLVGTASRRKLRRFACACCQGFRQYLLNPDLQHALEVSERYADDLANIAEMAAAFKAIRHQPDAEFLGIAGSDENDEAYVLVVVNVANAVIALSNPTEFHVDRAASAARAIIEAAAHRAIAVIPVEQRRRCETHEEYLDYLDSGRKPAQLRQAQLLRCIFGNRFRPAPVEPAWLAWNEGIVVQMARCIYDEHAFDRLPILADALEEAGCDNADILQHCRQPGEHVRGCWVIDLLLGKE